MEHAKARIHVLQKKQKETEKMASITGQNDHRWETDLTIKYMHATTSQAFSVCRNILILLYRQCLRSDPPSSTKYRLFRSIALQSLLPLVLLELKYL